MRPRLTMNTVKCLTRHAVHGLAHGRCPMLWQLLQLNILPGSPYVLHDKMFSGAVNVLRTVPKIRFVHSKK
jgi:hypothetical protein